MRLISGAFCLRRIQLKDWVVACAPQVGRPRLRVGNAALDWTRPLPQAPPPFTTRVGDRQGVAQMIYGAHVHHWNLEHWGCWRGFRRLTRVSLTERVPVDSESKTMKHSLISGSEAMVDLMWTGDSARVSTPKKKRKRLPRLQNIGRGEAGFSRPQKG